MNVLFKKILVKGKQAKGPTTKTSTAVDVDGSDVLSTVEQMRNSAEHRQQRMKQLQKRSKRGAKPSNGR